MKNYLCKPKRNDKSTKFLSLALVIISVITFYLSTLFPTVKALGQLLSAVLLLIFIQITTKFLLTDYTYTLEDKNLHLSSTQGKRIKNLGFLTIDKSTILFNKQKQKEALGQYKIKHRFSYCQNLFPKNPYYLLSPEEQGGFTLLVFEPDEALVDLMEEIIKQ